MSKPVKMWKLCHFKQNYTPELLIALKMVYSCFFGWRGNLDFPDFLKKMFYNINSWTEMFRLLMITAIVCSLDMSDLLNCDAGQIAGIREGGVVDAV